MKKNLLANYLGQGWVALMNLIFIPTYIKYLGIEAFGLIGMYALLQASLNLLDMGMTPSLSREMAKYSASPEKYTNIGDLLRSIELIAIFISIIIISVSYFYSDWISLHWINNTSFAPSVIADIFTIMGIIISLKFIEGIYRGCIIGLQKQVFFNIFNGVMATIRSIGAIAVLAYISPSLIAFFIWQGVITVFTFSILAYSTHKSISIASRKARFSISALSSIRNFSGGIFLISILSLVLMQSDKLLLSNLLPLEKYGYYTFAASISGALYVFITPITQALYPRFCELHSRNDDVLISDSYHFGAQLVSVVGGSIAIILFVFSGVFLRLWTNDEKLTIEVAPILGLLILGNLLNGLMWIPYHLQLSFGWTSLTAKINIFAVLLFVPSILWVVPRYGAIGGAFCWLVLSIICMFLGIYLMHKKILSQELRTWIICDTLIPIGAGFITAVIIYWAIPIPNTSFERIGILVVATILILTTSTLAAKLVRTKVLDYLSILIWRQ